MNKEYQLAALTTSRRASGFRHSLTFDESYQDGPRDHEDDCLQVLYKTVIKSLQVA
jgi:hypothetical protein